MTKVINNGNFHRENLKKPLTDVETEKKHRSEQSKNNYNHNSFNESTTCKKNTLTNYDSRERRKSMNRHDKS